MGFRKLQIAWLVGCGLACVLLFALWVRSYWWSDSLYCPVTTQRGGILTSEDGRFGYSTYSPSVLINVWSARAGNVPTGWCVRSSRLSPSRTVTPPMFSCGSDAYFSYVVFPCWLPVLFSITVAAIPRFRWKRQFSLRALLIATTLVAVVLGLIVYTLK